MNKLKYFLIISLVLSFLFLLYFIINRKINRQTKSEFQKLLENFEKYDFKKKIDIPIYYINMDKYKDRQEFMENHLSLFSNKYERVKGFNGYLINNMEGDTVEGIEFINDYPNLTKAEIGCTISHFLAIKKAYDNGDSIALILEDDTNLSLLNSIDLEFSEFYKNAPEDWEIIKMFHLIDKKLKNVKTYKNYKYLFEDLQHTYSCVGYIINRKCMEKILNYVYENEKFHIKKIGKFPTHGVSDVFLYEKAITYNLSPSIFFPDNRILKSTIHDDHTVGHIDGSFKLLEYYTKKLLEKEILKEYDYLMGKIKNVKNIKMPIYVINMDKNPERLEFMEKQLYNFSYNRIRGFNGHEIKNKKGDTVDGITFTNEFDLSNGEIGCTLSHLLAIKTAYDNGNEIALILEDDADVSLFNQESITNLPYDWEIIQLYYLDKNAAKKLKNVNGYLLHDNQNYTWSAAAYIINRKGMEKIIRHSFNEGFHIRKSKTNYGVADGYIYDLVKTYMIEPSIVFTNNLSLSSTIDNNNDIHIDRSIEVLKEHVIDVNHTVWQYWEKKDNKNIPGYISYCMNRVKNQSNKDGMNYILITPENLNQYIPKNELPKYFYDLKEIAHRADFVRIYILYYYGGMWIDADGFTKGSFIPLFNDLYKNEIVYWDNESKNEAIENSLLLSRPFSNGMKIWYNKIINILNTKKDIEWTEIGGTIFRNILNNLNKNKVYNLSETCFPIHWSDSKLFFKKGNSDFLIRENQPIVMLYNHIFPKEFKSLNDEEFNEWLITSDTVLADLMRKY